MRVIFALLLLCANLPVALAAPPVGVVKTPNGLTAWLVTDKNLPLINIKMAWRGGARTDPPKAAGLTALLAKLLTQGAGDMAATQFQVALDEHAIRLSFSADDDYVTGSLRCLSQYQARCFELLRLAITAPRFDASAIERLRRIQKARLKIRAQNPRTLAADNFFRMIFGDHPYGRPVGGTADGLDAITKQELQSHYQQVFRRDNVLIAVVGDISERVLAQQLDQIFAPAAINQAQATALAPKPIFPKPQHTHQQRASPQTTLLLGHGGINYEDADFFAAFVMNHILGGGGFSSRLNNEVREQRGLAYSVYSYLSHRDEADLWLVSLATDNRTADEAVGIIQQEMRKMRDEKVSPETLRAAQTYLIGSYALRFDSGEKIANQLLGVQQMGLPASYFITRNDKIRAVTAAQVQAVARRLLQPDKLFISSVGGDASAIATQH